MKRKLLISIPVIIIVILLISSFCVFIFVPTAPYYLKYHTPFYNGEDNSSAEYAQDIPYDKYISEMSLDEVKDMSGLDKVYTVSDFSGNNPVQEAFDAARKGGGIVCVSDDITVTNFTFSANTWLYVPKGVTLTVTGYRRSGSGIIGEDGVSAGDAFRFIEAEGADNIGITGGGTIKSTGREYWNEPNLVTITEPLEKYNIDVLEYIHFQQKLTRKEDITTKLIMLWNCNNITVKNIMLYDSPGWNISFELCNNVSVSNLIISSNYHGANTDGIDLSSTGNAAVKHCYISVGDDAVCLKNDKSYNGVAGNDVENITVDDCFIRSATNGFKIGTGTYHNISNVKVSNLTLEVSGIYPPTICGITLIVSEGGRLSDVTVENVDMKNVLSPLFIRLSNRNKFGDKDMTGQIDGITVKNISATGTEIPVIISGVEDNGKTAYVQNITLENFDIKYRGAKQSKALNRITDEDVDEAADEYPEVWMMGDVPASGIYLRHVKNVSISGCSFVTRSDDTREQIVRYDVQK